MAETKTIPFAKVRIPDVRASSRFTPEQREFFEATVKAFGVLQEPLVRPLEDGTYELIAGKSRILELAKGGAREAPMKVIDADARTAMLMHLAENVARGSVDPISVARVMEKLRGEEMSVAEIARILGKSETWVRRTLVLLELPDNYQKAIQDGRLTPTHVQIAAQMRTPFETDEALQTALRLEWNTKVLGIYVKNRLEELEEARKRSLETGEEVTAPAPEPERLVKYQQCLLCGFRVPTEKIQVMLTCDYCRDLVKYIIDQVGSPEEAIHVVYKALTLFYQQPRPPGPPTPPSTPAP